MRNLQYEMRICQKRSKRQFMYGSNFYGSDVIWWKQRMCAPKLLFCFMFELYLFYFFQFLMSRLHNQLRNPSKMTFANLICIKETVWIQQWILQALEMANLTESNIKIQNPIESHQVQIWTVVGKSSRNSISKYFLSKNLNDY